MNTKLLKDNQQEPETITMINGNGKPYTTMLPKIVILGYSNEASLKHIKENTGLIFKPYGANGYQAQPETANQIVALLMTYNFKTRYYNNANHHNTLYLKSDHHTGFDVDSICYDCAKYNNIPTNGFDEFSRLAC